MNNILSRIKPRWIIHIFALMHAVVALSCRLSGIEDELLLTLLTMTMALLLCFRKSLSIEFTASIIISVNIIGYLLGTLGASLLEHLVSQPFVVHAVSTALTTEILGWGIIATERMFPKRSSQSQIENRISFSSIKWIMLAAGGIFFLRLGIVFIYSQDPTGADIVYELTAKVLSNSFGIIILTCLNILYIRHLGKASNNRSKLSKTASVCAFMTGCALLETVLIGSGIPFNINHEFLKDFPLLFLISLLVQVTIHSIVYVANYAINAKTEMYAEREKAHLAQYRYLKLKRQVDPHFLFNCLNILDCLVCEEKTEQASTYIHKLAGIYRYMIKSEDEELVQLRDELVFVGLYVDLLKVRFPEGFEVEINVSDEHMSRFVLPCSLQLLIENATKHNAVTADKPLKIIVASTDNSISVSNVIIPKVTRVQSAGLGHKYLKKQYFDLSGKEIEISQENGTYCVTLPLL